MGQIKRRWNPGEDELFQKLVEEHGSKKWSFIKDLSFEKPQLPLKRSFSIETCINSGSLSESHLSNLEFSQLCLYPPTVPLCQNLPLSKYSPVMPDPLTSLSLYGSDLSNLGISRCPWLSLYPHIAPLGEIFPLSSVSPIIPNPLTIVSPYGSNLSNLDLSKLPQLSLNSSIIPLGEIMPLSSISLVLPGPSTTLRLSLPGFKSSENLNLINRIEQVAELILVSASEPTPSNFMPQTSTTQNDNSGLTRTEKQLLSPNILKVLQDIIQKEVKNYVSELENERDSMNTEATMDATVNYIGVSKD
ncbi:hypothetical protein R3W88_032031 [Solanum pinnatisectum]|uniref:HTH myb-type domain-containing protein n=1 Tax=Solanum pinnatisectum TaxID=50273 RepID=A0AAV9LRF8_9SOLN|nr:hypothetical protein R3W88_032031 [Solanum pinnatisectum]